MECLQESLEQGQEDRHPGRGEAESASQTLSFGQEDNESGERNSRQDAEEAVDGKKDETNSTDESALVRNKKLSESEKEILNSLNVSLSEQEEVYRTMEACAESKKQATKERISHMVSKLQELLVQKEIQLLDKLELEYSIAGSFLNDFVCNIGAEKQKVSELLAKDGLRDDNGEDVEIEKMKEDIDTSLNIRNDILSQFHVPNFVLNEQCLETVNDLNFGVFQELTSADLNEEDRAIGGNREVASGETVQGAERSLITDNTHNGTRINSNNESSDAVVGENAEGQVPVDSRETFDEKESAAGGATGISGEVASPSAPPILPEESPPPYWQAMGLNGPQEETQPRSEIPGYYIPHSPSNRLPENKLEPWHSFPVRRQYDRRGPMPVALTWNYGKICVVDRANMRVKFFSPNGHLITEMHFSGTEIHDVTFLEESQGESRYVVTSPKSKTLMIIGIDSRNTPKVIRKLSFTKQYSRVCRGPRIQTLMGAEVTSRSSTSVVNMITFTGQVLLSISHTPSFECLQYVKSVEVTGNHIIILDWKIKSVSVYNDDGTAVGEYRGTLSSPLINPLDMTLDNHGNIMILNTEFSNIHVVDLHCNPVEIIKLPRNVASATSNTKLIAYDPLSRRLATAESNDDIAVFTFQNGYDCLPQRNMGPNLISAHDHSSGRRAPEVLPLVEEMLPSTLEDIITRQPVRNRSRQFHL